MPGSIAPSRIFYVPAVFISLPSALAAAARWTGLMCEASPNKAVSTAASSVNARVLFLLHHLGHLLAHLAYTSWEARAAHLVALMRLVLLQERHTGSQQKCNG